MQKRRYFRIPALALLGVSLLLLVNWLPLAGAAPTASAHAFVIGSDPIDGSTLNKAPSVVRIYFDAPVSGLSQATVYAFAPGSANGLVVSSDHGTINATNLRELDVALLPASRLPQGGYEIKWTALSLTDGQTTDGLIGFNLAVSNTGVAGIPTLGPSTSNHFPQLTMQGALSLAWDWLVTLALLFWAGILITETFIIPRAASTSLPAQARKHSRTLQALCLAGLLVGELINLILRATSFTQTLGASGINPAALVQFALNTNYGHLWLARVVLIVGAIFLFWRSGDRQKQSSAASASRKFSRGFRQLRRQARAEATSEISGTPALSTLTRSQARITGAVTANIPSARSTNSSQAKSAAQNALAETTANSPSPWLNCTFLALAGLMMLSLVLSNEIIQLAPLPISAGLFSWLALAAQAIWFGCLAYLGFVLLPLQPTNADQRTETLIRILKSVRPFLLTAIGILLVSELFLGEATIQAPALLLTNPYGRVLLVRDVLLLFMLIFTGYALFYLLPRLQRQTVLLPVVTAEMPARRTRTFELAKTEHAIKRALHTLSGFAAVTLICVALMNFFAPPVVFPNLNYAALASQSTGNSAPASQTQTAGDLSVTLTVAPAQVGAANTVSLVLTDAQGNAVSNATVKLTLNMQIMDMGTASATINGGNTTYATTFKAGQTFTMAGTWVIQVEIDRPNQPAAHLTFHVMAA